MTAISLEALRGRGGGALRSDWFQSEGRFTKQ
jgi:hypothetical protein